MQRVHSDYFWPAWPWTLVFGIGVLDAAWLLSTPVSLDLAGHWTIAALLSLAAVIHITTARWPVSDRVHVFATGLAVMLLAWPALRLMNYAAMSTALPLADAYLASWDRALRFDWLAYVRWADQRPGLLVLMSLAYQGLTLYSLITFIALLGVYGPNRARDFVLAFLVAGVLTCVTGLWLPALGPMDHYAFDPAQFQHIKPEFGTWAVDAILRIRAGVAQSLSLNDLPGLTHVPSLHTAMGLIGIYYCRGRLLVYLAALAINGLMIAATPVFGGHYFIDLFAGTILAGVAIAAVAALDRRTVPRVAAIAAPGEAAAAQSYA
jgi:membrane-associated phospholipid phosphatase